MTLVSLAAAGVNSQPTVAQECLEPPATYATTEALIDDAPLAVAACDLDGDGDLDLVTANDASDTVSVLINDGQGAFGLLRRWPVSPDAETITEPVAVACCDFDGNGTVDLITANHTSDDIAILFNEGFDAGAPIYGPPQYYPVGEAPWAVTCAHFDEDAHVDIATANFTSNSVSVLTNDGAGWFSDALSYAVTVGGGPRSMVACDLDGDDDLDIATADFTGKTISLLRNDGNDGLTAMEGVALTDNPFALTCCDLDGVDGPDLVTANLISDTVTVAYNQTAFSFGGLASTGVADGATAVACGDLNHDGFQDIVSANLTSDDLSLFLNDGTGSLLTAMPLSAGNTPSSLLTDRLVGGPSQDVVATFSDGVLVYENSCGASGDIDGDGDIDLADVAEFQVCYGALSPEPACAAFDVSPDETIDLVDYRILHDALSGP